MNQLQAERRAHERQARDWEIKLKKLQEEIDSLTFQNQRLKKQNQSLTLLSKNKGMMGWIFGGSQKGEEELVQKIENISAELELKIAENEALHMQMFDIKFKDEIVQEKTELLVTGLRSELQQSISQVGQLQDAVKQGEEQVKAEIKENKRLRVECDELREQLEASKAKLAEVLAELETTQQNASAQIKELERRQINFLEQLGSVTFPLFTHSLQFFILEKEAALFENIGQLMPSLARIKDAFILVISDARFTQIQAQLIKQILIPMVSSLDLGQLLAAQHFGIPKEQIIEMSENMASLLETHGPIPPAAEVIKLNLYLKHIEFEPDSHADIVKKTLCAWGQILLACELRQELSGQIVNEIESHSDLLEKWREISPELMSGRELRQLRAAEIKNTEEIKQRNNEIENLRFEVSERQERIENNSEVAARLAAWQSSIDTKSKTTTSASLSLSSETENCPPRQYFFKLLGGAAAGLPDNSDDKLSRGSSISGLEKGEEEAVLNNERVAFIQEKAIRRILELCERERSLERQLGDKGEQLIRREDQVINLQQMLQTHVEQLNEREESEKQLVANYERQIQMMSEQVVELTLEAEAARNRD